MSKHEYPPRKVQVWCIQKERDDEEGEQGKSGDIRCEGVVLVYGVAVVGFPYGMVAHPALCGFLLAGFFGVLDSNCGMLMCLSTATLNKASAGAVLEDRDRDRGRERKRLNKCGGTPASALRHSTQIHKHRQYF